MQIPEDDKRLARIARLGDAVERIRELIPLVGVEPKQPIRDAITVLKHVAVAHGLEVVELIEHCNAPTGTFHDTTISINRWLLPEAQLIALLHQLAHTFDYRGQVAAMDIWDHKEIVAEAAAVLTAEWLGYPLEELSLVTLAVNEASRDNLMAMAFRIVEVSLDLQVAYVKSKSDWGM
ncbi:MAG TPA: hypothetical protein VNU19_06210 [Candidatus Acidoferrum sp.]|jgi:hypothetical protein|nr:hypothetical protein [Candidatus Acidoferrum sp.]